MNDDREDVFRRAAENYPLKTDGADWETVLKKMKQDEASGTTAPVTKKEITGGYSSSFCYCHWDSSSINIPLFMTSLEKRRNRSSPKPKGKTREKNCRYKD